MRRHNGRRHNGRFKHPVQTHVGHSIKPFAILTETFHDGEGPGFVAKVYHVVRGRVDYEGGVLDSRTSRAEGKARINHESLCNERDPLSRIFIWNVREQNYTPFPAYS